MAYDLLITNGRVVDGTGELGFLADVAVQDGKIVGVGKYAGAAAKRTIDAAGRVVAPGFIDHHTHYDPQAVWDPLCSSSVQNGHTMVIVGQCGQVLAPTRPGDGAWYLEFFADAEAIPLSTIKAGVDVTWESVGEYLAALGKQRGINVGTLVGHSGIRCYVMGEAAAERAEATPEELATMQRLVREAMQAGALGFSTAAARPGRVRHRRGARGARRGAGGPGDGPHPGQRRGARWDQSVAPARPLALGRDGPPRHLQPGLAVDRKTRGASGTPAVAGGVLQGGRAGVW